MAALHLAVGPAGADLDGQDWLRLQPWSGALRRVDAHLKEDLSNLSDLLRTVPLAVWGAALLVPESTFPRAHRFLPTMPADEVQDSWTGRHGASLLGQSVDFLLHVVGWLGACGIPCAAHGMDFGIGWGRHARLWLKYAPPSALLGADAWSVSLDHARGCRLKNRLALTDPVMAEPPARDLDFVWAFSVFTHLDPPAFDACLRAVVASLRPGGAIILTFRPHEYWPLVGQRLPAPGTGFHFVPHNRENFGDTSVDVEWLSDRFVRCGLERPHLEWSPSDPYQVIAMSRRRGVRRWWLRPSRTRAAAAAGG